MEVSEQIIPVQWLIFTRPSMAGFDPVQLGEPRQQHRFKLFWLNRVENGIETIMRRNASRHVQEFGKPFLLRVGKPRDRDEIIRSCNDSTDHHEQHIDQRINRFTGTRVGDVFELINKRSASSEDVMASGFAWPLHFNSPLPNLHSLSQIAQRGAIALAGLTPAFLIACTG